MPGPVANEFSPLGRVLSREMTRSEAVWNFGKRAGCVWSRAGGGRRWAGSYCHVQMRGGEPEDLGAAGPTSDHLAGLECF